MKLSDGQSLTWGLYSLSFASPHPVQHLDSLPPAMSKSCPHMLCHAFYFLTLLTHWDLFWLFQTTYPHLVWIVSRPWGRQVLLEIRHKLGPFTFFPNSCSYWETLVPAGTMWLLFCLIHKLFLQLSSEYTSSDSFPFHSHFPINFFVTFTKQVTCKSIQGTSRQGEKVFCAWWDKGAFF